MNEDLKNRTCDTCACMYRIEPPKVPTAQQLQENPGLLTAKPVLICRLNPPVIVATERGSRLMQQPTEGYISCWHWKAAGTLPGDALPATPGLSEIGRALEKAGTIVL